MNRRTGSYNIITPAHSIMLTKERIFQGISVNSVSVRVNDVPFRLDYVPFRVNCVPFRVHCAPFRVIMYHFLVNYYVLIYTVSG